MCKHKVYIMCVNIYNRNNIYNICNVCIYITYIISYHVYTYIYIYIYIANWKASLGSQGVSPLHTRALIESYNMV